MAAHSTYLLRRGATLVFRRRVPKSARPFFRKSFFAVSLRTHLLREARRRAAIAARLTDDLIGLIEACGEDMLEERQMDAVVDDLMRFEIEAAEALRETDGPRGPDAVTAAMRLHEATRETLRAALVYNDYAAVTAPLERTLGRLGLHATPSAEGWSRLARRAARGLLEVADENLRREQGIYPSDDRLPRALSDARPAECPAAHEAPASARRPLPAPPAASGPSEAPPARSGADAPSAAADAAAAPSVPPPSSECAPASDERRAALVSGPSEGAAQPAAVAAPAESPARAVDTSEPPNGQRFSAWFDAAIARKQEECPGWETNNLKNWQATRKLFIETHGDRPMAFYERSHLFEFRDLLRALPKSHHKSSDAPGLYTIIDEAEAEQARELALAENEIESCGLNRGEAETRRKRARVARVRVATVYRHLQAIQYVFEHAADHGATHHNMMKGVIWTKKQLEKLKAEEQDTRRLPWGDKLKDLLATSAFVKPAADGEEPPAVFWPTLLASHCGLREEEALQLRAEDVDTIQEIPIIRVQSGEGQHVKGGLRYRIVPIHRNLLTLGFLRFVEECRRRGQEWLFPKVDRCAAKGRLSGIFTKTFTRYRIAEGVYDPRRDFHSLRTHFHVELKRAGCPLEIRKRLMGHRLKDVTEENYDPEGSPIAEFRAWIDCIEIDISRIRSPCASAHPGGGNVVSLHPA